MFGYIPLMGGFVAILALVQTGFTAIMLGVLVSVAIRFCMVMDRYDRSDEEP
ncbi:hypothetical protein [Oceanicaulis sp. UBA2681]|uniref:hypothetical protein n=1 Tax=Oceanicaulis sp. UBA2681 TaxID=1947007 RepID=UPI00257BA6FD|nr:hypothetical protein [Oceanicaulis sp. UBA2681]|tara:strand:- start:393 stop:548 length:156 start_codon:yes stop_codon:yes gene_type:complete